MSTTSETPLTAGTRSLIPLSSAMPWLIAALFLFLLPWFFPSGGALTIMSQMAITIVFALAYNMLLGQVSFLSSSYLSIISLAVSFVSC